MWTFLLALLPGFARGGNQKVHSASKMGIALVGLGGFLCLLLAFVLERGEMSLNEGWMVGRLTCLLVFVAFALRLRMYQIWIIQYGLWNMGYCGREEVAKYTFGLGNAWLGCRCCGSVRPD